MKRAMVSIAAAVLAAIPGFSRTISETAGTQLIVTVLPEHGAASPVTFEGDDLTVSVGKTPARILHSQRLAGDFANMQLFVLLDDSTRSSSLGTQLPRLKSFVESLPSTTQVAIGYMRNGSAALAQAFTVDHDKAAAALRLPLAVPGGNGSPYFTLSDLAKHWPSKELPDRRAVLMLTDGVDRYYGDPEVNDPYADDAVHDALKAGVMVYSIYLRGAGIVGFSGRETLFAQSRLGEASDQTGGYAYFQDLSDPVSIAPFLSDLQDRLDHQYQVTIEAPNAKGIQPVKVRSEVRGVKIEGPTRIYVR
jgi:hypothetical protein